MTRTPDKWNERLDWRSLPTLAEWALDQALAIQQIPAPTFQEAERAAHVQAQMESLGLTCVERDELQNVYGLLPGENNDAAPVMIAAHTDTVFSINTPLDYRRDGDLVMGPGLGDNCIGVAAMLALARYMRDERLVPASDIWFVATTREEGLGNLGGMKAAFERLGDRLSVVINLEGVAFGHVYNAGIAVRRLHISTQAEGGHSWLHFGHPSAIHGLIQLGARILEIEPPQTPRTTYNIGMIGGGSAINAIATEAHLWLDMRSEASKNLEKLEAQVRAYVSDLTHDDLRFTIEVVGDRPAGMTAPTHSLVQDALAVLRILGVPGTLETGSTDANVPLAQGCPAVTIGVTRGGNAHRLDEYIEVEPIALGLKQLILLALTSAARSAGAS